MPQPLVKLISRFMISPEEGAKTTLYCATQPQLASDTGFYYEDCKVKVSSPAAQNINLANELWEKSLDWAKQ